MDASETFRNALCYRKERHKIGLLLTARCKDGHCWETMILELIPMYMTDILVNPADITEDSELNRWCDEMSKSRGKGGCQIKVSELNHVN